MSTLSIAKRKSLKDKHLAQEAEWKAAQLEKVDEKAEEEKLKANKN